MCHGFEEGIVSAIMFEKIFLGFVFKIDSLRAGEVTQWVRAIAAKPDGLSSGSETHGGGGGRTSSAGCPHTSHGTRASPCPHTQ